MSAVLWLMALQGGLGAFDTAYYHELRARLPVGGSRTRPELWLHAARSLIYALLFATLPFLAWQGALALVLGTLIAAEIVITLADFAVEVKARVPDGVLAGERVTHGLMAIIYGAMLAKLIPVLLHWSTAPTTFSAVEYDVPVWLAWALLAMAASDSLWRPTLSWKSGSASDRCPAELVRDSEARLPATADRLVIPVLLRVARDARFSAPPREDGNFMAGFVLVERGSISTPGRGES